MIITDKQFSTLESLERSAEEFDYLAHTSNALAIKLTVGGSLVIKTDGTFYYLSNYAQKDGRHRVYLTVTEAKQMLERNDRLKNFK